MAKPYFHAKSSAKNYGGIWEDYMEIHELMDSSKATFPDNRHRALTHNAWFIGHVLPRIFGETFKRKSDGKIVNTRDIGELHVLEDFKMKFIPSAQDFLENMDFLPWMQNGTGTSPNSHKKLMHDEDTVFITGKELSELKSKEDTGQPKKRFFQPEIPFEDPRVEAQSARLKQILKPETGTRDIKEWKSSPEESLTSKIKRSFIRIRGDRDGNMGSMTLD